MDSSPQSRALGTLSLPLLAGRQPDTQRAILKVQDGCDAHCTYCIIPKLRPIPWHKPIDQAVQEARAIVAAGHSEIVLTGVFLGAYGYSTALRNRQSTSPETLASLIDALCTQVPGLRRLRLSSLEPGDLTTTLLRTLAAYPQVMPHFHLPLQSGSDHILRRMNRQYTSAAYLQTINRLRDLFDRPAFTTDIIVGFPGEADEFFAQTLDLVRLVGFLHIHAFPFSPRRGTAAARWQKHFVHQQTITDRMHELAQLSLSQSLTYREQFVGQTVEILVEHPGTQNAECSNGESITNAQRVNDEAVEPSSSFVIQPSDLTRHSGFDIRDFPTTLRHGRCERYFPIHFEAPPDSPDLTGQLVRLKITRVTPHRALGQPLPPAPLGDS